MTRERFPSSMCPGKDEYVEAIAPLEMSSLRVDVGDRSGDDAGL